MYFDVSKFAECNNHIPYQENLYLDLVIKPNGKFKILDEGELCEALQKNTINEFDYHYNYLLNLINYILMIFEEEIRYAKI